MKKLIFLIVFLISLSSFGQVVKMQAQGAKQVTTTQRDALTVPSGEFWQIYNITTAQWEYWDGDSWEVLDTQGSGTNPTTSKGDISTHDGATPERLPVSGNNGYILSENSATVTGLEWIPNSGGGESTTVSDTGTVDLTLTGSDITADVIQSALSITESQISDLDHTVAWGTDITGDINNQTDLIDLLNQYSSYQGTQILEVNYYWVSSYTYHVNTVVWLEDGILNTNNFNQDVVLDTADPTNPRVDRVVLNITSDTVYDLTGTPAGEPAPPELAGDELELFFVNVPINGPPNVVNDLVYDENLQEVGGEWDTTVSGSVVTNASTEPSNGTLHTAWTTAATNAYVEYSLASPITATDGFLIFKFKQPSVHNFRFGIRVNDGTFSYPLATIENGIFGADNTITTYQTIVIPFEVDNVQSIRFINTRNNSTIYFDEIYVQTGVEIPVDPLSLYLNNLADVDVTGATDGQGITYNSATQTWVATTISGGSESTTVGDTAEIDLTLTGVNITGAIVASSIDETKLDASTNASLDLADTALQNIVEDLSPQLGGQLDVLGNSIITSLANTDITLIPTDDIIIGDGAIHDLAVYISYESSNNTPLQTGLNISNADATGDALMSFSVGGALTPKYLLGIDNSDVNNSFVISQGSSSLGTSDLLKVDLGGRVSAPNFLITDIPIVGAKALITKEYGDANYSNVAEVDGSITNEGSLTVGAGTGTTSLINSNTSGSTAVTLEAGTNITLSEVGNTITIAASGGVESTTASNGLTEVGDDVQLGGTLTSNTTIEQGTNSLLLNYSGSSNEALRISTTGSSSGSGLNVNSEGSISAVFSNTSNASATVGISKNDTSTNNISNLLQLSRSSTGSVLNGFGISIEHSLETSTSQRLAGLLQTSWTTATDASRTSQFKIDLINSATQQTNFVIDGNGTITAPQMSTAEITSAGNTALITKEYGDANYGSGSGDDVSTFAEKTGDLVGTDRLVGLSGATDFSETISGIPLSIFNDDLGHVQNATHTGEVTGATALTIASGVVDSDNIVNGTIDEVDLDASVNASLDLADTALQAEVDGSTSNELQTIANTSDATSHTATLSSSGGSLQLIEGSGVTLTTGGTGLNGTLTIASTGSESTTVSDTAEIDLTLTGSDISGVLVASSIDETKLDASTNASLDLADSALQSEVDGSVTNEGSLTVTAGTGTTSLISSNTSGSTDVTLTAGTGLSISEAGNVITLANTGIITEVDGSISNEGSLTVAAGTSTTSIINSNTSGQTGVTLTAGTNMNISESGNVITLSSNKPTLSKGVTIISPVATDDVSIFFTPVAITVTNVASHITGTTNVVYNISHASTRTGTALDVYTSDITLTSTSGQSNNTGFNDNTIPANNWVWLDITSVSGTPTRFHATVIYTED